MASHTILNSESDEDTWIIQINQLVSETNLTVLSKIPVCIYQVPKSLSCVKPEAFTPQLIAIGPYNHFRLELYPMERFKVYSAKKVLDYFNKYDLKQLVKQLHDAGPYIRACYHKYLDLKDDTLLYTMAIDGLFLLNFLHDYLDGQVSGSFLTGLEQEVQISGVKFTKDAIIRDMLMVENQIPVRVLLRILLLETSEPNVSVEEKLGSMLLSFCEKHCPLNLTQSPITCSEAVTKHYHLLDLMYHLVISQHEKSDATTSESKGTCKPLGKDCTTDAVNYKRSSEGTSNFLKNIPNFLKKVKVPIIWALGFLKSLKDVMVPLLQAIKRKIDATLGITNVPMSSLETFGITNVPTSSFETFPSEREAPVVVTVPSVCELHSVGIRFQPSKGGIMAIEFDEKKGKFYLPLIKLDVNSEVIMRNLVAHEALTKPDFFIFTRYTELMRAIIDTVEDVKLLKVAQIIDSTSSLGEKETEELFNGMSKSIGPTKTENLDNTIRKVNKYFFHDKRKSNLYRMFTEYVSKSWKLFTLLATFMFLAMTALETFCSVYDVGYLKDLDKYMINKTHTNYH